MTLGLATVNAMDRDAFVAALGSTFERSAWVAQSAWTSRPFASVDALHRSMIAVVERAPADVRIAFLCGHPDLAGREAIAGTMTDESVAEQGSIGLDALSSEEMGAMRTGNARYRARHGFPFIIAVRRHTKAQIFAEMQRRSSNETADELVEAMRQIGLITRHRLAALVADTTPSQTDGDRVD